MVDLTSTPIVDAGDAPLAASIAEVAPLNVFAEQPGTPPTLKRVPMQLMVDVITDAEEGALTEIGAAKDAALVLTGADVTAADQAKTDAETAQGLAEGAATSATTSAAVLSNAAMTQMFTRPGFYNTAGVFTANTDWRATELIEVAYLDVIRIKLSGNVGAASVAFYTADGAFISASVAASNGAFVTVFPAIPGTAFYVAFSSYFPARADELFNASVKANRLPHSIDTAFAIANSPMEKIFTRTGYLNTAGALVVSADWRATELIEVAYLDVLRLKLYGHTVAASIAFYDANRTFISAVVAGSVGAYVTEFPAIPSNAMFVAFTSYLPQRAKERFDAQVKYHRLPNSVDIAPGSDRFDAAPLMTNNGWVQNNGVPNTDVNFIHSGFIECNPGDVISCRLGGHAIVNSLSFYDAAGKFLSRAGLASGSGAFISTVTVPELSRFYRVSAAKPGGSGNVTIPAGGNTAIHQVMTSGRVTRNPVRFPDAAPPTLVSMLIPYRSPERLPLISTSRIGLCGDSRSSTQYTWYRDEWIALTGASVQPLGFSGTQVAFQTAPAQLATVSAYFDAAQGDALMVILPGGNDTGAATTVGTFNGTVAGEPTVTETNIGAAYNGTTIIQAIDHFVRYMKARYANPRALAGLTGSETEAEKNAKIALAPKVKIVLLTDIPVQHVDASNAYSQAANWQRKRAAIIEVGHKNKVHTVDALELLSFDMSLEPYFVGPTNFTNNNGVFYMDGVHLNQFGSARLARLAAADLGLD